MAKKKDDEKMVTCCKATQEMLDVAATRAESQPNLSFVLCSAEKLDCPDSSFDCVVCQQGFQFFSDKSASAREILRVLRDGGQGSLSDFLASLPKLIWNNLIRRNLRILTGRPPKVPPDTRC